ncbi:MAG: lysophospholipid acyltransferase family protein [Helicobacteraceae bacterium]|jgi:lysophospholipid acyltransferase (LPLAT)-like uncharacterized protein|nr:lysophospholipid acyltransferase family protein [Helicobacteraceae bacterium]
MKQIFRKLNKKLTPILLKFAPFLGFLITTLIYFSCKKKFIGIKKIDPKTPVIVAFWHENILMAPFHWKMLRKDKKNREVFAIVSDHKDGEYITRVVSFLGIGAIRGSSTKGGVKALVNALRELKKNNDVAFTPDGPQGPRHSIADGIIHTARKTNLRILPLRYEADRAWILKSWDRFKIPKPFATITFICDQLLDIQDIDNLRAKELLKNALGNDDKLGGNNERS